MSEYRIQVDPCKDDTSARDGKSSVRFNVATNFNNKAGNLFSMAFPHLPPNGTYPYICLKSNTNDTSKLVKLCNEFFSHLMLNFQLLLQAEKYIGSQILNLKFQVGSVGNKVLIAFVGMFSSISEDVIFSITQILDRLAISNFNLSTKLSSSIDLNDLKESDDRTFEELLSAAKAKSTIKDKKLVDFLLRGFTLSSRLTGGFNEASAQGILSTFEKKVVPGYVKSILNQILGFKNSETTTEQIGEILSPTDVEENKRFKSTFLDNFNAKIQEKLADSDQHYADIYDLSDILGKEISSVLNMGGIFVNEFFEGLIDQSADEFEIGIVRWNCHVELGVKSGGLIEYLGALYSKME